MDVGVYVGRDGVEAVDNRELFIVDDNELYE